MLQVAIESSNVYYEQGLQNLLGKLTVPEAYRGETSAAAVVPHNHVKRPDVIFRDFMVSIHFYGENRSGEEPTPATQAKSIHIPFVCKGYDMEEIEIKLRKIMTIAYIYCHSFIERNEVYKIAGLKQYLQLSTTENNIMLLVGQGNDAKNISILLKRSERTISTHCRNALKKMGMENRLGFYKYASCLARFGKKGEITICI